MNRSTLCADLAVIAGFAVVAHAIRSDAGLIGVIGGLDDQRVAFPVAARIAHVLADVGAHVRAAVERDHAALMDHFVAEHHVSGRLHDLVAVVVDDRDYGASKPRVMQR